MKADEAYAVLNRKIEAGSGKEVVTPLMLNNAVSDALINAKKYTDDAIGGITSFNVAVVDVLPTENIDTHTIYFVPNSKGAHNEYMYINGEWELIGNTEVDLSEYAKEEDIPTKTSELTNDSGYITDAGVTSVNKKTGNVTLSYSDVGAISETGGRVSGSLTFSNTADYLITTLTANSLLTKIKNDILFGITGPSLVANFELNADHGLSYGYPSLKIVESDGTEIKRVSLSLGSFYPYANMGGDISLGGSNYKWADVYSNNSVIQTSDRNEKNHIEELSTEKSEDLIYGLKPSTYQMNGGTSGRTHWGMISQDIEDLLEELGWTSSDFAGFIKSPKMTEAEYDEKTGKCIKESEIIEGKYLYSLRYDEFIAPMIKVIQAQHKQIETLAQKLELLEAKTANLEYEEEET